MHVYLSCVLSICPSIYLHYSTVLIIPQQVDLSNFPLSSLNLFDFLSFYSFYLHAVNLDLSFFYIYPSFSF